MSLPPEEIPAYLASLRDESRALIKQLDQIGFYMRGGVDRDQAWRLTYHERESMLKLIQENLERAGKAGIVSV